MVRTTLPRSLPRQVAKSLSVVMTATIASPVTGPFVPGVHGFEYAISGYARGVSAIATIRRFCQPRPNAHGSSCTLTRPHAFIVFCAQAEASLISGELVRRGPYTSVR